MLPEPINHRTNRLPKAYGMLVHAFQESRPPLPEADLAWQAQRRLSRPIDEVPRVPATMRQAAGSFTSNAARPISFGGWLAIKTQARPIA